MKVRSTGLGDTEMVLSIQEINRCDDCLILVGQASSPVKWKIRMAASYRDMWRIVKLVFLSRNIFFLIWKTVSFKSQDKIAWPDKF